MKERNTTLPTDKTLSDLNVDGQRTESLCNVRCKGFPC